ncbi:transglutaminase [Betaproteobacteria bacterium]|nr:transglutaminase [Betaproteobacteria bacterium]GHU44589.1 transglutaminase [Betaproteobacteria bacterium]
MKRPAFFPRLLLLSLVLFAGLAQAQSEEDADTAQIDVLTRNSSTEYAIDAEGRVTMVYGYGAQILFERALEGAKTRHVTYSRGIQEAEILEAYTLKADGRRIDVPKDNYQTHTRGGMSGGNPFFSDNERITVVFPDVAVGDTTYMRYRQRDTVPIFPGHASIMDGFSSFAAIEEGVITLSAPKNLKLTLEAHHLETLPASVSNGIVTYQWRYRNPQPRAWDDEKDSGVWHIGESPELYISTFKSYADIARAYGERALPKAEPTGRVRALAAEIVGAAQDPREQARLLYEWVSTQLSYAGNDIGVGTVVPRDLDVTLDNRMGDCKDHATLLQALLTARGIASEQVLIDTGRAYELPETPTVWSVNHVINYLPQWGIYADATADNVPFGDLPKNFHGKPVIHINTDAGADNHVRAIPLSDKPFLYQDVYNTLKIAADGSASGNARVRIAGLYATQWREFFMNLKTEQRAKFVNDLFARQGIRGKGTLHTGDLSPEQRLSDELEVSIDFQLDNFLKPRTGAFLLGALFSYDGGITRLANVDDNKTYQRDHPCWGGALREVYDITLEPGVQFTRLPEAMNYKSPYLDYTSAVQRHKNGVRVERTLLDKSSGGVCSVATINAWFKAAATVGEHLQEQVFFKRTPK